MFLVIGYNVWVKCRSCEILVPNSHAPIEEETDASRDTFCKELEQAFYQFIKHKTIFLGNFNKKVWREGIFLRFPYKTPVYTSPVPSTCYIPHPTHSS
jgi:hypothetical protein